MLLSRSERKVTCARESPPSALLGMLVITALSRRRCRRRVAASASTGLKSGQDLLLHPEGHAEPVRGDRRPRRQARARRAEEQAGRLVRHAGHGGRPAAVDPGRDPVERGRHRDRRQRPRCRLSVAEAGDGEGDRGRGVRLRHELPPALHQPGRHRDDRPQPDPAAREADGLQGRVRDPLGRVHGDEPERVDRLHEEGAEEAGLQEHEAGQDLLRQRQPGPVAPGDGGDAPGLPEPEGHRVADHGRDLVRRAVPLDLEVQGQGRAAGPRPAEPDEEVRAQRHREELRALEPGGPRVPRGLRRRGDRRPATSRARSARRSRPASSAPTRSSSARTSGRR